MNEYDSLVQQLKELPDDFKERKAALDAVYGEATQYRIRHQEMLLKAGEADMHFSHLQAWRFEHQAQLNNRLREQAPLILKNAIRDIDATVFARKQIGSSDRIWGLGAPTSFQSFRDRTPADDAATARAEKAQGLLNSLFGKPTDLIEKRVKEIRDELRVGDEAALWESSQPASIPPEVNPVRPHRLGVYVSDKIEAEIEAE